MSTPGHGRAVRPNPFAVPSGTSFRFGLLIVAVTAAVLTNGIALTAYPVSRFDDFRDEDRPAYHDCMRALLADAQAGRPTPEDWNGHCHGPSPLLESFGELIALALFWLVVLACWWLRPGLRIRRRGLRPFPAAAKPREAAELAALARLSGVAGRVEFLVDHLDPTVTGLAFGRPGRRYVVLSRGLLAHRATDPAAYRAVVLHELAHTRNRDLDITFITDSAWRVYLLGVFVPAVFSLPLTPLLAEYTPVPAASYLWDLWQLTLLAVLVPLARNSVLRSRELHADARAARYPGAAEGLTAVLAAERPRGTPPAFGARPASGTAAPAPEPAPEPELPDVLSTHPSPRTRLAALADPGRLFAFGPRTAFALGLAGCLARDGVTTLTAMVLPDTVGPPALLPLALVLGAGLAFGVWRGTLAAVLTARRWNARGVGPGFGLGLAVGTLGANRNLLGTVAEASFAVQAAWFAGFAVLGHLYTRWLARLVRAWAPAAVLAARPAVVTVGTAVLAVLVLDVLLSHMFAVVVTGSLRPGLTAPPVLLVALLAAAVAAPLLGGPVSRRMPVDRAAVERFLLSHPHRPPEPPPP
ncbi:M56 family metallopeptidase [Kitasatospora sp. NPDC004240]